MAPTDDATLISGLNNLRRYRSKGCRQILKRQTVNLEETGGGRPRILRLLS